MNGSSLRWKMIVPIVSSIVVGIVITVILVGYAARMVVIAEIEKSTLVKLRDTVLISITTMMTSGSMSENKEVMVTQMKDTASLRLIRAHALDDDYGKGDESEYPQNSVEQQVIDTGEAVITRASDSVHGVFPYVAGKNILGINCLECHNSPEGAVLGALEIRIPLAESLERIRHYQYLFGVFGLLGTLALTLFIYLLSKRIFNPLEQLATNVTKVSDGDLTIAFDHQSKDEIGILSQSMNDMVKSFRELIGKISSSSTDIVSVVDHLSVEARAMAEGSEDQASQILQVATANEEMAATSGDIAHNCQLAEESAREAEGMAHEGASVVKATITVMSTIADRVKASADTVANLGTRSDQIGAIVGTIEDIADQTNLLALNAAIEAARAGEMGRGFAVVADEVRALAERTTRATREISDMIKAIQDDTSQAVQSMEAGVAEVENGTREATSSGEALERIMDKIAAVTMQVSQIATAAGQQTSTIHEINTSIQMVADVAQRSGDVGKEVLGEVEQLTETSQELKVATNRFRFN
ncbi:MAG: methyl-accepting chemotaxis protein [Trichlorobacter sp.]|nr:methyl-accepting chemotaxis protein [Trichlorobacter sp.]